MIHIGDKIERWTILAEGQKQGYRRVWKCRCDCGIEREVLDQNLRLGRSKSCGCYSRDVVWTGHGKIPGTYWARLKADSNRRQRSIPFDLTIEDAWSLFEKQSGRCALTGTEISFAETTREYWAKGTTASLDRIDSSSGYELGNVQWVHKDINKMKQNFPEERFIELCKMVVEHAKT